MQIDDYDLRNRLSIQAVEAVECLHSWLGGGLLSNVIELCQPSGAECDSD